MSWFDDVKTPKLKKISRGTTETSLDGVWEKCKSCREIIEIEKLRENLFICPLCNFHNRLSALDRIQVTVDENSFVEFDSQLFSSDPLEFKDKTTYAEKIQKLERESAVYGKAQIGGIFCAIAVMDFTVMGGSMGVIAGEKIARAFDLAIKEQMPVVVFTASGGARMQEGILSLMQMAKISSVRQTLSEKKLPYIAVLTDPTTGGVAASFAMQGDITLAEPNALIGFEGPRVIQQAIHQNLPEGFQRSEFLLEHGFVDTIVERKNIPNLLKFYFDMFMP